MNRVKVKRFRKKREGMIRWVVVQNVREGSGTILQVKKRWGLAGRVAIHPTVKDMPGIKDAMTHLVAMKIQERILESNTIAKKSQNLPNIRIKNQ